MKIPNTILVLFALLGTFTQAEDAFQEGIDAYHDSEYENASSAFKDAVTQNESAAAHHNLAISLYQEGKPSDSVWHLERALLLEPTNEQYYFKLGALRQELGLPNARPEWHELASRVLSQRGCIILLSLALWLTLAAVLLPKASGCRVSLQIKAARLLGLTGLFVAGTALYLNRDLANQGIVLGESQVTLHAAPASAAPQVGLGRPGERGQQIDQHNDYIKIETEGGAQGWIRTAHYRLIQSRE